MMPTTRHLCPLPDCGWYHDEPDPTADEALQTMHSPAFAGFTDLGSLVEGAMLQRVARVEASIEAHISTHSVLEWMREVRRLNDLLAAAATSTDQEPPC